MQWMMNLAIDFANTVFLFVPLVCYTGAVYLGLIGVLQLKDAGVERHRRTRHLAGALAAFVVASFLAGFPAFVNMGTATVGGRVTARFADGTGLLAYQPPASTLGTTGTVQDSFLALVDRYAVFFIALGVVFILLGLFRGARGPADWRPGHVGAVLVHIFAGVALVNIRDLVPALMNP